MAHSSASARTIEEVQVRLAEDAFYPQMFRWAGRHVRVLSIEGLRTCGAERRFRVRTVEGVYELTQDTRSRVWRMRQSPSWFSRTLSHLAREPRYSLPSTSRRAVRARSGRAPGRA